MRDRGSHRPEPVQNKRALQIPLPDIRATAPGSAAPVHSTRASPLWEQQRGYPLSNQTRQKLNKLLSILGKMAYSATSMYIHRTQLLQIVETESWTHVRTEQQAFVSEDHKNTFNVTRVKYNILHSRDVAVKAKEALATIEKTSTLLLSHSGNSSPTSETPYRSTTRWQPT